MGSDGRDWCSAGPGHPSIVDAAPRMAQLTNVRGRLHLTTNSSASATAVSAAGTGRSVDHSGMP